jgi:Flp pilus assembly protein TadD
LCAVALSRSMSSEPAPSRPPTLPWVLLFCQPLSFVFYGHAETYPVMAAILGWSLVPIFRTLRQGTRNLTSLIIVLLLPLVHFKLLVLLPAYLLVRFVTKRFWVKALGVHAALAAILVLCALALDALRRFTIFSGKMPAERYLPYLLSLGNAAILLLVPAGIILWPARTSLVRTSVGRFCLLSCASLLGLFTIITMDLGPYSDADLLTSPFIILSFAIGASVPYIPNPRRRVLIVLLAASPPLVAWLTLTRCPAGEAVFLRQVRTRTLIDSGKIYEYEVLGLYQERQGRTGEALHTWSEALRNHPGSRSLLSSVARLQLATGDTVAAIRSLERAAEKPDGYRLLGRLSELYTRRGDPAGAIALLERHRDYVETDATALASLAVAYFRRGAYDSTIALSDRWLQTHPEDPIALNNLAAGLIATGCIDQGLSVLMRAAQLYPGDVALQTRIVVVLLQTGRQAMALQYVESIPGDIADSVRAAIGLGGQ